MRIGIDIDDTLTDVKDELYQAAVDYAKKFRKENIENLEDSKGIKI